MTAGQRGSARCAFVWCITLPNWSLRGTAAIINVLADAFKRMAIAISMVTAPSIFMEFFIKPPLCVVTSLKCVYVMRVHAYTWHGRWRSYVDVRVPYNIVYMYRVSQACDVFSLDHITYRRVKKSVSYSCR